MDMCKKINQNPRPSSVFKIVCGGRFALQSQLSFGPSDPSHLHPSTVSLFVQHVDSTTLHTSKASTVSPLFSMRFQLTVALSHPTTTPCFPNPPAPAMQCTGRINESIFQASPNTANRKKATHMTCQPYRSPLLLATPPIDPPHPHPLNAEASMKTLNLQRFRSDHPP